MHLKLFSDFHKTTINPVCVKHRNFKLCIHSVVVSVLIYFIVVYNDIGVPVIGDLTIANFVPTNFI